MSATTQLIPARLRSGDMARVASVGLRTRRLRAALSALGIAIGVAAIVAVLGLSASSQAGLLAEINRLGTNLLTVTNGQSSTGQKAELPIQAPSMIGRIGPVYQVQYTAATSANAYRSPLIPAIQTGALTVDATSLGLPHAVGTNLAQGSYLNAATAREPVCVLGAAAAQRLGIDHVYPHARVWLGGMWFYVIGILKPAVLAPEIDGSALVGYAAAKQYLNDTSTINGTLTVGPPTTIYARSTPSTTSSRGPPTPKTPATSTSANRRRRLPLASTPRARSTVCSSASAPSPCSSAPLGWRTS